MIEDFIKLFFNLDIQKSEENIKRDEEGTKKSELKIDLPDELSKPVTPLSDNDNALVYIERILKEVCFGIF